MKSLEARADGPAIAAAISGAVDFVVAVGFDGALASVPLLTRVVGPDIGAPHLTISSRSPHGVAAARRRNR